MGILFSEGILWLLCYNSTNLHLCDALWIVHVWNTVELQLSECQLFEKSNYLNKISI